MTHSLSAQKQVSAASQNLATRKALPSSPDSWSSLPVEGQTTEKASAEELEKSGPTEVVRNSRSSHSEQRMGECLPGVWMAIDSQDSPS